MYKAQTLHVLNFNVTYRIEMVTNFVTVPPYHVYHTKRLSLADFALFFSFHKKDIKNPNIINFEFIYGEVVSRPKCSVYLYNDVLFASGFS